MPNLQKEERQRILEKIPEGDEPKKEEGDAKTRKRKKKPHGKIGFENLAKVGCQLSIVRPCQCCWKITFVDKTNLNALSLSPLLSRRSLVNVGKSLHPSRWNIIRRRPRKI